MDIDEKLFALGYRLFKKFKTDPKPLNYEQRVELRDIEPRLHIIAKSLCGEPIQVHEAERMGGFSGIHFYYPRALCPFADKKLNELLYIHRTLFYSSAKQLGFSLPPQSLSVTEKQVYTCLAVYQVNQLIQVEYPGAQHMLKALSDEAKSELNQLSGHDQSTQSGVLGHWIYELLSGDFGKSSWHGILCAHHKNTFDFWRFADSVYKEYVEPLPAGPALADEAFVMWGLLMPPGGDASGETVDDHNELGESLASGTEIQGKNREEIIKVNLEKAQDEANPVMHAFEKVETVEEYQGGMRTQDGDDNLSEHAEALDEVNIREVVRSRERTNSLYKADIRINGQAPDVLSQENEGCIRKNVYFYPEWDFKARAYKNDWCRVEFQQHTNNLTPFKTAESYEAEKREIKKLFEQVRHKPLWKKRQRDGEELDIDALVDHHADLKSGNSFNDRFFLRNLKHKKSWECLLLLDCSLSTDSWVANERVLDVIKNSVALLGEALPLESDCISVAAFHSNTRHQCVYQELKGLDDSWTHLSLQLNNLEPVGYTRIGPALRHSLALLRKSPARHKFILLLSDGKASDYDQYEGRYGIEDIKQVLREAQREQVHVKCLAIEEKAKFYLPQMFGQGNVQILSNPHKLPRTLSEFLLPLF